MPTSAGQRSDGPPRGGTATRWDRRPAAVVGRSAWGPDADPPARPSARPPRSKRKRRVIGWAALGAFALGVSGVVIAVQRGQDVCEVSATGIKFCAADDDTRQEIEQGQPEIEEQVGELQSQAQQQATGETAPGTADLGGTWFGDNGFTYVIEQFGARR